MPIFPLGEKPNAMENKPSIRKILIACTACSYEQAEPAMVISTKCHRCGEHLEIKNEKSVPRIVHATRLANRDKPPVQHPPIGGLKPAELFKEKAPSLLRRIFSPKPEKREIDCYHCDHLFEVISSAQSTQCRKCGSYISLKDYEIDQIWHRRIQTRGDVTILKGGSISGVNIQCHDLTVFGSVSASVDCSGTFRIRSHGKIIGNVKCRELRVERGAKVEFQGDVNAQKAYIDGEVKAQLTCVGTITLEKKAHLQGLARAGGIVFKAGAKHTGLMEVIRPESSL